MPYYPMMDWYPYMGFGMGLIWIIVLIVIAYLIYRLIKERRIFAPQRPITGSSEDILAERYAKGEITREQYLQMKEDLKGPPKAT